jgi:hypothetical protein
MLKALMKVLKGRTLCQRLRSYVAKKFCPVPEPVVSLKSMSVYDDDDDDSLATSEFYDSVGPSLQSLPSIPSILTIPSDLLSLSSMSDPEEFTDYSDSDGDDI